MSEAAEHRAPSITLGIGGVRARFEADEPGLVMRVDFPRTRFVVANGDADALVRVRLGDPHPGEAAPWFRSGGTWEMHHGAHGGDRVAFWTQVTDTERAPMIRLDLAADLSCGEMMVDPRYAPGRAVTIGFPVDEWLTARLLARRGEFILHASSIEIDGEAYVFTGHSGAGKSTISAIAEQCGARVLSDDRTVLAERGGAVFAAGTPWHGSYASGCADVVPVRGVFLLEQADTDLATSLPADRAFAELMVRTIRPTAETAEHVAVLDAVERVVEAIPTALLRFRPTPAALDTARTFVSN